MAQYVCPACQATLAYPGDTSLAAKGSPLITIEPAKQNFGPGWPWKFDNRAPDASPARSVPDQPGVAAKVVESAPDRGGANGTRISQAP
jgi:hypothetical protein